jgi:hypothetical protein
MARAASMPWYLLAAAVACGLAGAGLPLLLPERFSAMFSGVLVGIGLGLAFAALVAWQMPEACDAAPAALRRRYAQEMARAMGAYIIVLVVSLFLLRSLELAPLPRTLVALLPVPPIAMTLRAMIRYIRDADEMQQRIELEAVSLATAVVALGYMTGGFLQLAEVIDVPSGVAMLWVFPLLCIGYGLAKVVVSRRYR